MMWERSAALSEAVFPLPVAGVCPAFLEKAGWALPLAIEKVADLVAFLVLSQYVRPAYHHLLRQDPGV
jgi:hypothetical protein